MPAAGNAGRVGDAMTALDDLCKKRQKTQLEWAILVTLEAGGEATAADAAEERAALKILEDNASVVIDGWKRFGFVSSADMDRLEKALLQCVK